MLLRCRRAGSRGHRARKRGRLGRNCADYESAGESIKKPRAKSLFAPRRSLSDWLPVPPFDYLFGTEKSFGSTVNHQICQTTPSRIASAMTLITADLRILAATVDDDPSLDGGSVVAVYVHFA